MHDSDTFLNGICAIALNLRTWAITVCDLLNDIDLVCRIVIFRDNIRKAIDTADDLCCVLAKAVEDDAQRILTNLICRHSDTYSTLSSCEGLMACEESKAASLLIEEHSTEIAMANTDLAVICNRARNAERLKSFTDSLSCIESLRAALLYSDCCAERISPLCVLESDRLKILDDLIRIDTLFFADFLSSLDRFDAVLLADFVDTVDTALIAFK